MVLSLVLNDERCCCLQAGAWSQRVGTYEMTKTAQISCTFLNHSQQTVRCSNDDISTIR